MLISNDGVSVRDILSALSGETGRFEVTLSNGVRFVVTVEPGVSLDAFQSLWEQPGSGPYLIRKLADMPVSSF